MTFTSKVCTVEKSCQVRRVKAVQDLSLRLGHGPEDSVSGKLSLSSGKGIETPGGDSYKKDGGARLSFLEIKTATLVLLKFKLKGLQLELSRYSLRH